MIKNNRKQDEPIIKVGISHGDFNGISYEIIILTKFINFNMYH